MTTRLIVPPEAPPGSSPVVSIVVPCYCEEEMLPHSIPVLISFLEGCINDGIANRSSEIVLVDDGSPDATWDLIVAAHVANPMVRGVRLSNNCGHQNALLAGLETARGEFVISIDADLQDDVNAMRPMIEDGRRGVDIVYGVRKSRPTDSFFKRFSAEGFYKLMCLFGVDLVFNHADFHGMSRRALAALLRYREKSLFLRGLVRRLGFRTSMVYYDRKERLAGESKYPLRKMLAFAVYGIASFSFVPLRLVTLLGVLLFALSVGVVGWILWVRWFTETSALGWSSMLAILSVFSGIQLLCLGVIGEYLAIIFNEVKARPRFYVADTTEGVSASETEILLKR